MSLAGWLAVLVAVATAAGAAARRFGISEPLVLTLVGLAGSYLPFIPDLRLTPNIVLVGFLPPLLYTAAIRTSLVDFKANKRPIAFLSVGLVVFTTFGVALVAWALLPISFPIAVALGAVVAPPDAVAATAIARRTGLPRRVVTILEGESLFNDATALVTLRTAIAAVAATVSVVHIGRDFAVSVVGGIAVGVVVAYVLGMIRRRVTDPVIDTTISFLAPFAAYLPAERIDGSGVLAVVTAGLILGQNAAIWQGASSRIAERTNWRTVQFVLENAVFVLIGLQVRSIVTGAWRAGLGHERLLLACLAVLGTVVLLRPIWVFPATYLPRLIPAIGRADPPPSWKVPTVISWAGMRGVVTLAAVFVIPADTPYHPVLVLIALVVVGGTLLVQGTTLPVLVRRMNMFGPSRAEDALQIANLLQQVTAAGERKLRQVANDDTPDELVEQLLARDVSRANSAWERLGPGEAERRTPSESYRKLRLKMLHAERTELLRVRDTGVLDHEVLQVVMAMLDLEESMIDRVGEAEDSIRDEELILVPGSAECNHLRAAPRTQRPDTPGICQECIDEGVQWVHLRMCLSCGHVACCDSSPRRHATAHNVRTTHPVMRSVEPGEAWRWCYVDDLLG
jgi:CPA1 family monovalent cation:H+ antiporter